MSELPIEIYMEQNCVSLLSRKHEFVIFIPPPKKKKKKKIIGETSIPSLTITAYVKTKA